LDTLAATLKQHNFDTTSFNQISYGSDQLLYSLTIPFADRTTAWLRLRTLVDQTACWPVIMTDLQAISDGDNRSWAGTSTQILEQAAALDPEAWLIDIGNLSRYPDAQWIIDQVLAALEREHEYLGDDLVAYEELRSETESALASEAIWMEKETAPTSDEQLGLDYTSIPEEWKPATLDIVLFSTTHWWEIPALIRYYPADPGPNPATHVSLFHRWSTRYGAELVSLGRDGLTLRATRPPRDRAEALTLAWEHTLYCEDIYILDIVQRAVGIYRGVGWGFWWD